MFLQQCTYTWSHFKTYWKGRNANCTVGIWGTPWRLLDWVTPFPVLDTFLSFRFQIFLCPCFLFLYGSAVCFNELSTFAILKFQAKLCPLIPSVDNSCFNWTLPASYYQLSSHWDVWIELLLMKLKFGEKGNNFTNLTDTIVLCLCVSDLK